MTKTIDMREMRHLNLFEKITRIHTRFCFNYNDYIFFCVPHGLISRAVGENGKNVRQIHEILGKRIKIISQPQGQGISDIQMFVKQVVSPVTFKDIIVSNNEIIITAGSQSKAALIGRNKRRLLEMQKIIKDFFGKGLRIV